MVYHREIFLFLLWFQGPMMLPVSSEMTFFPPFFSPVSSLLPRQVVFLRGQLKDSKARLKCLYSLQHTFALQLGFINSLHGDIVWAFTCSWYKHVCICSWNFFIYWENIRSQGHLQEYFSKSRCKSKPASIYCMCLITS